MTTKKLSERITPGKWQWYWSKGANDDTAALAEWEKVSNG